MERFQLGFSDRMLGPALPDKNRRAGAELRGQLERLGIFRKSGHEHLRGSLVVPVMNLDGDVVQLYGRKINDNLREGTDYHLYLPGPMRGVWNEEAFVASKDIILCESLIDALTFWCAGYRNVTASYGVNGFTKDHRAAFERHGTKRVYIAYDADEAGNKAAAKLAEELMQTGRRVLPRGVPEGHGRERIRAEGDARGEESWSAVEPRRVAGQRDNGQSARVAVPVMVAPSVAAPPEIIAAPKEEQAAKEKMIEQAVPEPVIEAAPVAPVEPLQSQPSQHPPPRSQSMFFP